jgi:hypothetical protein
MAIAQDSLLVKFRTRDTSYGVTRATVKALAGELDITETQVIHIAISKFAQAVLPAYQPDEGPLTARQVTALRKDVQTRLPRGKVLQTEELFK